MNGSTNEKFGLARSVSVMPGDTLKMEVYAKYVDSNTANWTGALNTLMGQISANTAGVVVDGTNYTTSTTTFPYPGLQNTSGSSGTGPKAFLNWLIFDRDYNFITGGYQRMSTSAKEYGQDVAHEKLSGQLVATQPGYVYIYLSNEETTPVDVFFDDFKVTQVKSPVVQSDDYYPFGLAFNSYSRENSEKNRWKFQGQEHIDDLDLGWDSFKWRNHMPDIGRFFNVDPLAEKYLYNSTYAFSENKVVAHIELEGLEAVKPKVGIGRPSGNSSSKPLYQSTVTRSGQNIKVVSLNKNTDVFHTSNIKLKGGVKQESVSDHSAKVVGENMAKSGNSSLTVTSTQRSPSEQADAMYHNASHYGAASQKELYGPNGDKVIDTYSEARYTIDALKLTGIFTFSNEGAVIQSAMENTINEIGPSNVSNHCGDPSQVNVLDISPSSLTDSKGLIENLKVDPNVSNIITPPKDPAIHIEIPQGGN